MKPQYFENNLYNINIAHHTFYRNTEKNKKTEVLKSSKHNGYYLENASLMNTVMIQRQAFVL